MSTNNTQSAKVVFLPSQQEIEVPTGTAIQEAAERLGLHLNLPCGGQGRCGRCRVKVEQGKASQPDNPHLTPHQRDQGWVLSCEARVAGDLVITVPPAREQVRAETSTSRTATAVRLDWPLEPLVRRAYLQMEPPTLHDNAADLERLTRAARETLGIAGLQVSLELLRRLPEALRRGDWKATVILRDTPEGQAEVVDILPGEVRGPLWGAAVDVGTTNVVVYLADLTSGKLKDFTSSLNRQVSCGEDVISRIIYSLRPGGLRHLQDLVLQTLNDLLKDLALRNGLATTEIYDMVMAGNTTMTHLFLGVPPQHIREEPYPPVATHFPPVPATELGINVAPNCHVSCLPSVAAYVGGDVAAGVVSSGLFKKQDLTLFLDVGTNGEIVLGNSDWLMTDACSAGPAFEGAGISCGMRATDGAIEDVHISSKTLEPALEVIGEEKPVGVCGSGLIAALAEMRVTGIVNRSGRINVEFVRQVMGESCRAREKDGKREYVLAWASESATGEDIALTEADINSLIRVKGAIYAGIAVMLRHAGVTPQDVTEVLIGGSFGRHIDVEQAIQIGLLPDLPWERFRYLGNTSALGAFQALLSHPARAAIDESASRMTYLELIADNTFMEEFTAASFLPHTEMDRFPSVKKLLREAV